jgi:serine/threonine protein kinase
MNSIAPNESQDVDDRAKSVVVELRRLVDSDVDRSFIIQRAVTELTPLAARDGSVNLERYSAWLSSLDADLRSSICRQLEVEGYLKQQTWFAEVDDEIRWPHTGDRVAEFHLLEEVGRGRRSRVFLCRQAGVGDRQVIVKFTYGVPLEADVLGRLRHSNIVPVYFAAEARDGLSYICMPFLGRSTLVDFIEFASVRSGSPRELLLGAANCRHRPTDASPAESAADAPPVLYSRAECVAWLGWRLASALSHAHDQGIVHGDVKPSNVLLSLHGNPLLVDFNLSGSKFHSMEAKGGTLPYMPPEQLQSFAGEASDAAYDQRSDLFSLGTLLFEALTGRLPFPVDEFNGNRQEYARQLFLSQREGPPPLRTIDRGICPSVANAIQRCLAFHPERRMPSAHELAELFGAEFNARRRAAKVVKHHWIAATVGCASVISGVGIAAAVALSRPPEHERLFQEGISSFQAGEFSEAAVKFDRSLMLAPDSTASRFNLGRSLLLANELTKALDCFQEFQQREKSARGAAYIAYCLSLQGKMEHAAAWYAKALQYSDASPEVHNNIAVAYEFAQKTGMSDPEKFLAAKEHLRIAQAALPNSPTLNYNRLRVELSLAETIGTIITAETAELAESLAQACPDQLLVQVHCARVFVQRSPLDKARLNDAFECLNRAVALGFRFPANVVEWRPLRSHSGWSELVERARSDSSKARSIAPLPRFLEPISLIDQEAGL